MKKTIATLLLSSICTPLLASPLAQVKMGGYSGSASKFYNSGVFNRAFYLLATTNGWNTHKAYDVFVKANTDYWTHDVTFKVAACGVLQAAEDLGYDKVSVKNAFLGVGIETKACR